MGRKANVRFVKRKWSGLFDHLVGAVRKAVGPSSSVVEQRAAASAVRRALSAQREVVGGRLA